MLTTTQSQNQTSMKSGGPRNDDFNMTLRARSESHASRIPPIKNDDYLESDKLGADIV